MIKLNNEFKLLIENTDGIYNKFFTFKFMRLNMLYKEYTISIYTVSRLFVIISQFINLHESDFSNYENDLFRKKLQINQVFPIEMNKYIQINEVNGRMNFFILIRKLVERLILLILLEKM